MAAAHLPVARVCVDLGLAHLDRPFDYLVPEALDEAARPGVRVRVRFSGQLVDGFLLERAEGTEHTGRLAFLERVVSPEPVLTGEVAALARAVAGRYAGTLADVLRLAVPPRHARAESAPAPPPDAGPPPAPDPDHWREYATGPGFLRALAAGGSPRAVWSALPGEDWPARMAEAVAATVHSGRGAVAVVADARDLDRLDAALHKLVGERRHAALSAALGPAERYRRFLAAARGQVPAVVGTRAAMFAPVHRLGLVAIWDDGDDLHAEPRAPYPHAREVLLTRAQLAGAAVLVGGYARSVEAQLLLETGWAKPVAADRATVRRRAPAVHPASEDARELVAARLPSLAWRAARDALAAEAPVLIQVPRRGYLPAVACAQCRTPARCPHCHGPLALPAATGTPACRWCARGAAGYACPVCGGRRVRAAVVGARRTAEELGRAFAGVPVRTSGRDGVLASVPDEPALLVATPGAEPVPEGPGYGAVLLLDTWALLTRADLRATEETLRRWLAAAALARPAGQGGTVVVVADGGLAPVQALLRFAPATLAERELASRRELGFPPAVRMASLTGAPPAVAELLELARLPDGTDTLGPVPLPDGQERMLLRVPRSAGRALADALHEATGVRTAKKAPDPVRVQVDPLELI
ncbi:MAG: hypothetical protein V7603_5463 [Micromonosporaceae bacterium]